MIVSIRQQFEHLFSGDIMKADKAADYSAAFLYACASMLCRSFCSERAAWWNRPHVLKRWGAVCHAIAGSRGGFSLSEACGDEVHTV